MQHPREKPHYPPQAQVPIQPHKIAAAQKRQHPKAKSASGKSMIYQITTTAMIVPLKRMRVVTSRRSLGRSMRRDMRVGGVVRVKSSSSEEEEEER
jgi:hypothetical protein